MFGRHALKIEEKGRAAVAWAQGLGHDRYEDRFRLLTVGVPLVAQAGRGEVVAVFDGAGGLVLGMYSAQAMADGLLRFYRDPERYPATSAGVRAVVADTAEELLAEAARRRLEAGCAGTVAWLRADGEIALFHAGDTLGVLVGDHDHQVLTPTQPMEGRDENYFGMRRGLRIHTVDRRAQVGDWLVLASDGVTAVVEPQEIAAIVRGSPLAPAAAELVAKSARDRGTLDDVTVLVCEMS